jgi:hypothetical protein
VADDEYEEEQEIADEFDSDFNDEVIAVTGLRTILLLILGM